MNKNESPLQRNTYSCWNHLILCIPIFILLALLITQPVYAANLATGKSYAKNIIGIITPIFDSSCVLCLGLAIVKIVLSRDQKSADDAYKWAKSIIIAFIIFNIGGTFISWVDGISGMRHSYSYQNKDLADAIKSADSTTKKAMLTLFNISY